VIDIAEILGGEVDLLAKSNVRFRRIGGQPPLPARLTAGLAKHTYDLSDEVLCERWTETPYYQFFCGEEFSSIGWCSIARR
jgi:transposase-like protein DUF772